MSRDWDSRGRGPKAGFQARFDQRQSAAGQRGQLARQMADLRLACCGRNATAASATTGRRLRPSARALPLHQVGSQRPLGVSPAYRKLVEIIARSASEGGRRTALFWPASEISPAAGAVLTPRRLPLRHAYPGDV